MLYTDCAAAPPFCSAIAACSEVYLFFSRRPSCMGVSGANTPSVGSCARSPAACPAAARGRFAHFVLLPQFRIAPAAVAPSAASSSSPPFVFTQHRSLTLVNW
jgi:hypothetical protein